MVGLFMRPGGAAYTLKLCVLGAFCAKFKHNASKYHWLPIGAILQILTYLI